MRLRVEYEKGKELKYLSHLQLIRLVERVLRRAKIPYGLSEGFNPHIKLSLGTILPVGVWGKHEYFDIEIIGDMPAEEFGRRLQAVSPVGFRIREVREISAHVPALQTRVNTALYRLSLGEGSEETRVNEIIKAMLAQEQLIVPGRGKKGKYKDLRPGIYEMRTYRENDSLAILMMVKSGDGENIRPDEVVDCLANLGLTYEVTDICRCGNYEKQGNTYISPLGREQVSIYG